MNYALMEIFCLLFVKITMFSAPSEWQPLIVPVINTPWMSSFLFPTQRLADEAGFGVYGYSSVLFWFLVFFPLSHTSYVIPHM